MIAVADRRRPNGKGAALAVQSALPALKRSPGVASIVLFSSVAAAQGFPLHASIGMAKGAVSGLTLSLAAELAPKVRVNAIAPSLTRTPLSERLLANEPMAAALKAHQSGEAPLPAAEGFVRQIIGWREYVRGVYWQFMPEYAERNALGAELPLPEFYWTGESEMNCLREAIGQTLELGYAHHIQRLMVTGLYALLLGVKPAEAHRWYLAVYTDAVEWVELPNVLGMSQYADGGAMASKPYVATGQYIQRMSNYCEGCRFAPEEATGPDACPFTTLYWDFLMRHEQTLRQNIRMALQLKNLDRLDAVTRSRIRRQAQGLMNGDPR